MSEIKITPLGGLGRTGALNCMLYETDDSAIIVDCGAGFVDERFPGVNILVPSFDYLESKKEKLKAIIVTHGHEDHVGGIPYLLQKFKLPIYATPFAKGIILNKITEFNLKAVEIHDIESNQSISLGDFQIEPVFIKHSIMDVVAFQITVGDYKAFHCTDFKIDDHKNKNKERDIDTFKKIGKKGLDLLLLDSTNALVAGSSSSEFEIKDNVYEVFDSVKGRLIACLFSSNTYRLQTLLECARATGRKVALTGRSTKEYFRIAASLDKLDLTDIDIYDVEDMNAFSDEQILVIVTGSQAEPRSVLNRISQNMFRPFKAKEGDALLMTSRMIPGNEGRILHMLNNLAQQGVHIITDTSLNPVHVSGHAMADELKKVIKLLKPKSFIPIHGEYRYLCELAKIAKEQGVNKDNVAVITDGDVVAVSHKGIKFIDQFTPEVQYVSENPKYFMTPHAIRRRRKLSFNGLVVVSVLYSQSSQSFLDKCELHSEGVFGGDEEDTLKIELKKMVERLLKEEKTLEPSTIDRFIRTKINKYMKSRYDLKAEVVVMVNKA